MISAILKYSIGSLLYGGLITVSFLSLFIFLIKGWYKDAVFRPISFIVLGVLSLIVLWNSTIICGALAMKSDISSIQTLIENAIESSGLEGDTTVDLLLSNEIFQQVTDRHPILSYYADNCDFTGWTVAQLPSVMCDTLKEYLNGIIIRSLLWAFGFVIAGAILVIKTMDRRPAVRASSGNGGRGNHRVSRNAGTRTPSRHGRRLRSSRN